MKMMKSSKSKQKKVKIELNYYYVLKLEVRIYPFIGCPNIKADLKKFNNNPEWFSNKKTAYY